jgi:virulence-associated protein VagC
MRTISPRSCFAIRTTPSILVSLVLVLSSPIVHAGVEYEVTVRVLTPRPQMPFVQKYYVNDKEVRLGATQPVRLFKEGTLYVLTPATRSVQEFKDFTVAQLQKKMDDAAANMASVAAKAPPERRAITQGVAAMIKQDAEHQRQLRPPEFQLIDRSESVGGYRCRIWESVKGGAKSLELCVAPTATIPGGAQVLKGMEAMLGYVFGGQFALGVEFGPVDSWPAIKALGGVPILVRQFSDGQVAMEFELTNMRERTLSASLFQVPPGYSITP